MRVIHKASLVFKLKDLYSKAPVINAVILCNGKQNPYTGETIKDEDMNGEVIYYFLIKQTFI